LFVIRRVDTWWHPSFLTTSWLTTSHAFPGGHPAEGYERTMSGKAGFRAIITKEH
jgi:hypothetical protein